MSRCEDFPCCGHEDGGCPDAQMTPLEKFIEDIMRFNAEHVVNVCRIDRDEKLMKLVLVLVVLACLLLSGCAGYWKSIVTHWPTCSDPCFQTQRCEK